MSSFASLCSFLFKKKTILARIRYYFQLESDIFQATVHLLSVAFSVQITKYSIYDIMDISFR